MGTRVTITFRDGKALLVEPPRLTGLGAEFVPPSLLGIVPSDGVAPPFEVGDGSGAPAVLGLSPVPLPFSLPGLGLSPVLLLLLLSVGAETTADGVSGVAS